MKLSRAFLSLLILIAYSQTVDAAVSAEQMRALGTVATHAVEYSPKPDYPFDARAHHVTGAGIFIIIVHANDGRVAAVHVARTTGHTILDDAAVHAFSKWRFKPGALNSIAKAAPWRHYPIANTLAKGDVPLKIPCDFTMR